jgi:hypothetical protein
MQELDAPLVNEECVGASREPTRGLLQSVASVHSNDSWKQTPM